MKPMLAGKFDQVKIEKQLPVYGQPKLDGIRMIVKDGVGYSRSLKRIPNAYVQKCIAEADGYWDGFDGELMIGDPTDPDVYRRTNSGVMSHDGEPDFKFHVFDLWDQDMFTFEERYDILAEWESEIGAIHTRIEFVESKLLLDLEDIATYEAEHLEAGHEGIILRGPQTLYKFGRATATQGQLIKVKRFKDAEARIIGFEELMHNHNAPTISETGHQVRSSHKENKVGGNVLGKLVCAFYWDDDRDEMEPVEIRIGSGFDTSQRKEIWENQEKYINRLVKFKYFPVGVKDKPRHPIFLGFRNSIDLGD